MTLCRFGTPPPRGFFEQSQLLTAAILAPRTVWSSSTYTQIRVGDCNKQFRQRPRTAVRPPALYSQVAALDPAAHDTQAQAAVEQLRTAGASGHSARAYSSALKYWAAWYGLRYRRPFQLLLPVPPVQQFILDDVEREVLGPGAAGDPGPRERRRARRTPRRLVYGLPPAIDAALVAAGFKTRPGALSLATVHHRLSMLSKAHRQHRLASPACDPAVWDQLEATRRAYAARDVRLAAKDALTQAPLARMLATCTDGLLGVRDRALLLFGWGAKITASLGKRQGTAAVTIGASATGFTLVKDVTDSRLFLYTDADGSVATFLGTRDANGLPTAISSILIQLRDATSEVIQLDVQSRPALVSLSTGGQFALDWTSDSAAIVTARSPDGTAQITFAVQAPATAAAQATARIMSQARALGDLAAAAPQPQSANSQFASVQVQTCNKPEDRATVDLCENRRAGRDGIAGNRAGQRHLRSQFALRARYAESGSFGFGKR